MTDRKRYCYFFWALLASLTSFCLMCISIATNYWIISEPTKNSTIEKLASGKVYFGLLRGYKVFDSGFGTKGRDESINVVDYIKTESLYPLGLWVLILALAIIVVIFNIVSTALCLLNLLTKPFRTEQGPIGVTIVNLVSSLLTLVCVIVFVVIYSSYLSASVLTREELKKNWISDGKTSLGWSFYLLVGALMTQMTTMALAIAAAAGDFGALHDSTMGSCCCRKDFNPEVNMHDVMIY